MQKRYAVLLVLTIIACACFTQGTSAATVYHGGGDGTHYQVTIGQRSASFLRTGPHDAGATIHGARLVSRHGATAIYATPIPKRYWRAVGGRECRIDVEMGDHGTAITGIRASSECIFYHGATLGFGLYGGEVLHKTTAR